MNAWKCKFVCEKDEKYATKKNNKQNKPSKNDIFESYNKWLMGVCVKINCL